MPSSLLAGSFSSDFGSRHMVSDSHEHGNFVNLFYTCTYIYCVAYSGFSLLLEFNIATLRINYFDLWFYLTQLLVASNANVGGPATAAAMASAKRWQSLVSQLTPSSCCLTRAIQLCA